MGLLDQILGGRGQGGRGMSPMSMLLLYALGDDTVSSLAEQAGINDVDLLNGLSQDLPEAVDQLTPDGRLPSEEEAGARWA